MTTLCQHSAEFFCWLFDLGPFPASNFQLTATQSGHSPELPPQARLESGKTYFSLFYYFNQSLVDSCMRFAKSISFRICAHQISSTFIQG